ncbi:hypothetical protein BGX38DRAFT_1149425 [Terfezia claveryi]|nr:hypothetical protein BGX38DRAFT_1149425 [Terfezia claveryi]
MSRGIVWLLLQLLSHLKTHRSETAFSAWVHPCVLLPSVSAARQEHDKTRQVQEDIRAVLPCVGCDLPTLHDLNSDMNY